MAPSNYYSGASTEVFTDDGSISLASIDVEDDLGDNKNKNNNSDPSLLDGTVSTRIDDSSSSNHHDTPEALVRRENCFLSFTKTFVLVVLVGAATATSYLAYHFVNEQEQNSFDAGFDGVATKVAESMKSDAALKFWMARSLANTITLAMQMGDLTHTTLTLPPTTWERITQEARFTGNANLAGWSPLLVNDTERIEFETLAQAQNFTVGANPVCFVCGSERRGYTNPDALLELTGFGAYPCSNIELSGRTGIIPAENCEPISQAALAGVCECGDLPDDVVVPTNMLDVPDQIFRIHQDKDLDLNDHHGAFEVAAPLNTGPYSPLWQMTVLEVAKVPIMYDQMSDPYRSRAIRSMMETEMPVISEIVTREGYFYEEYGSYVNETSSFLYYPVFDSDDTRIVGSITLEMLWSSFMTGIFPPMSEYVDVVVETSCDNRNHTFKIDPSSNSFVFVAEGDHHDPKFHDDVRMTTFEEYEEIVSFAAPRNKNQSQLDYCRYRYMVFPTQELQDEYITNEPAIYASICAGIFLFTSIVFIAYDKIVAVRQHKVMTAATRTNDLVATLFPKEFRDRLYEAQQEAKTKQQQRREQMRRRTSSVLPSKMQMQTFLTGNEDIEKQREQEETLLLMSEPIADLFPHATVMFLDIAGFTAWSAERDPHAVFRLLETIYAAFDETARSLGVFKVETIGDTYVAVCGLPQPRANHAVVMAQFSRACLRRMAAITKQLERYLGPSTGELKARIGLHSGPVTAGVLRGEKARFQLFGSTVNTAARFETSGKSNRIHCSQATRDLLVAAGKTNWVTHREETIHLKGIGEVESYWVTPKGRGNSSVASHSSRMDYSGKNEEAIELARSNRRLVAWNVEVLYSLLENVVAHRQSKQRSGGPQEDLARAEHDLLLAMDGKIVIDELTQVLEMADFDEQAVLVKQEAVIDPLVKRQLHTYIAMIADLYRGAVPFHNFQHASHVIMSAEKLMKRIMRPEGINYEQFENLDEETQAVAIAREIHEATHGMSSDPVMQFAVVFSSLIHDVDHTGLTNAELVKMGATVSTTYNSRSVAEQNSVDLSWNLLMNDQFKELRACIYSTKKELYRFRQLVVNAVMATDIADKGLKENRQKRWDAAFTEQVLDVSRPGVDTDRRATITFEYIIQASDISHTMQHWLTYQKFNGRLFEERYLAWINGHAGAEDPSVGWYKGEIGFFDFYIIPLAKKLDKCGVFGVSHHEFLHNAQENKNEWIKKGEKVTAELLARCQAKYGTEVRQSELDFSRTAKYGTEVRQSELDFSNAMSC